LRLECRTDRRGNPFELPRKHLPDKDHFELWGSNQTGPNARLEAIRTCLPTIVKRFGHDATTAEPTQANLRTFRFVGDRSHHTKFHFKSSNSARTRWVKNESQRVQDAEKILAQAPSNCRATSRRGTQTRSIERRRKKQVTARLGDVLRTIRSDILGSPRQFEIRDAMPLEPQLRRICEPHVTEASWEAHQGVGVKLPGPMGFDS